MLPLCLMQHVSKCVMATKRCRMLNCLPTPLAHLSISEIVHKTYCLGQFQLECKCEVKVAPQAVPARHSLMGLGGQVSRPVALLLHGQ